MAQTAEAVGLDSIWCGDHLLYDLPGGITRGPWEVWTTLAALAAVTERDRTRTARRLDRVPRPGDARQAGRDRRRHLRRTADPRARCRVERARVPGLRLPVRPSCRSLRRGADDHQHAAARRPHRLRRRVPPSGGLRARSAGDPTRWPAADDRLDRPADAVDRPAGRRQLERVVQPLRQHRRRVHRGPRQGRRAGRVGRAGPGERRRLARPCSSASRVAPGG